jgi:hypothetical protein
MKDYGYKERHRFLHEDREIGDAVLWIFSLVIIAWMCLSILGWVPE